MQEHDKTVIWLLLMGAIIGIGKLLAGSEPITWRLVIGRMILGSATTTVAGVVLLTVTKHQQLARINIIAATSNDGVDLTYAGAIDALTADLAAIST